MFPILEHMQRCPQYQELASNVAFLCQACMEAGTRSVCEKFEVMAQARMGLSLLEMEVGMVEEERKLGGGCRLRRRRLWKGRIVRWRRRRRRLWKERIVRWRCEEGRICTR